MPFIEEITRYKSLSIVGMEKNTGKTVCLNYVLGRLNEMGVTVGVTSIGVDGEQVDSVYATAKPEITLYEGTHFITSEKHYSQRRLIAQIEGVDTQRTSLGQLITAEVLQQGKVLLSGAATTVKLREQIETLDSMGVALTIVDGALSRMSLASPSITEAMILCTGAAVSPNLMQLVSKTKFVCQMVRLNEAATTTKEKLTDIDTGIWAIDEAGEAVDLKVASVFLIDKALNEPERMAKIETGVLYVAGAVSDRLLKYLAGQKKMKDIILIVKDFTKLFITPEAYHLFKQRGGRIEVLRQPKLLAVCVNPTSPQGYRLRSEEACEMLSEAIETPVYDVMEIMRRRKE